MEVKELEIKINKARNEKVTAKYVKVLLDKVLKGYEITKDDARFLYSADYNALVSASKKIRETFCGDSFDMCTIINAKSGKCPENCKFCAQSAFYHTSVECYGLLPNEVIIKDAIEKYKMGIPRYSLVSSGKNLSDKDIDRVCEIVEEIHKEVPVEICISGGLISEEGFEKLKKAGVRRIHNNLETSRNYFPSVCTTHSYDQKLKAIADAKEAGMEICSGGIIGLGESREDRLDMIFELKKLKVNSIPINVLNPIPKTPLENNEILSEEEINRTVAVYRFVYPSATLRLAGGRALMKSFGRTAFEAGANAAISGDMLTTHGVSTKDDIEMIESLDYKIRLIS
ncbi:biotin synthase BioB [uncultured Peptoniphilus sp.]|uniref:biotin synthase BioB n=1 Tax=uncultured Peptoniphilus sp. TaxID=254354 RepID=UPI00280413A6|nr:biotin synthase BioB [uncultured Peptoniphilus sp.]